MACTSLCLPLRMRYGGMVWVLAVGVWACGCTDDAAQAPIDGGSDAATEHPAGSDPSSTGSDAHTSGPGAIDAGSSADPPFSFRPSNIAIEQLRLSDISDLGEAVLDSTGCQIAITGAHGDIKCHVSPSFLDSVKGQKFLKIRLEGGPLLDVFVARSWTITERTTLPAGRLMALVALEDIVVEGRIDLMGRGLQMEQGTGTSGGGGAGGGGFCGHGGAGAYSELGRSSVYGTPELIPPRTGSGGGQGGSSSGSGGGFLHLLAGRSVHIAATGRVTAGGSKGYPGGGGGSGGASSSRRRR